MREEWPAEAAGPTGVLPENRRLLEGRAGAEPGPYKKTGRIGHYPTWAQPGAKRGKRRKSLRPRTKTASLAVANAAERPRKVRCQAHPAEEWQDLWALVQTSPRNSAPAPFLFWTVHGLFSLFGATEKRKQAVQIGRAHV